MRRKAEKVKLSYVELKVKFGVFWPLLMGTVAMLLIFGVSVTVYMHLESWDFWDSVYMVVITLSTVGFQEVHQLSKPGRIFTSFLIFCGVGSFMFMAGSIAQLLAEGTLHEVIGRRRMQRSINRLKDHFIVCGYGRIGSIVTREIRREGYPVVVIEQGEKQLHRLKSEGVLHLEGDATSDEILLSAGLERSRTLITALNSESANVYVVLTARQLSPHIQIISRADDEAHINRLELAGANRVVLPHTIGGMRMAQTVLRPTITSFLELAVRGGIDLQMEELFVGSDSELVDKDLIQSQIRPRFNLIVVAMKKANGEMLFNPAPQSIIEAKDTLLTIGRKENLEQLRVLLCPTQCEAATISE